MYWLYSALLAVSLVLGLPFWFFQLMRRGKYRAGLSERFGIIPQRIQAAAGGRTIWVHAVSVGEVLAVIELVKELERRWPSRKIFISTTTATGQKLARTRFGEERVFYFPLDFAFAVRAYMKVLRPELVVVAETEFWPNFLRLAKASGAKIAVINARISDRSLPGYLRFRGLLAKVLRSVDIFLAQTQIDADRLKEIGAPGDRVRFSGNLKFDAPAAPEVDLVTRLRKAIRQAAAGPVLVCGSTMEGEERLLLRAFQNVLASYPKAVMILAPRHPERFEKVAELVTELRNFCWRRSQWEGEPIAGGVFLLDSIGELASAYSLADIAFVGGSLVSHGGHNILEPAQFGVPIVVGTSYQNFRDIVNLFQNNQALRIVGPAELPLVFMELATHPEERRTLGRRAAETLKQQAGATLRTAETLRNLIAPQN